MFWLIGGLPGTYEMAGRLPTLANEEKVTLKANSVPAVFVLQ